MRKRKIGRQAYFSAIAETCNSEAGATVNLFPILSGRRSPPPSPSASSKQVGLEEKTSRSSKKVVTVGGGEKQP